MGRLTFEVPISVIAAGKFRRYKHLTLLQHFTIPAVVFGNIRDISRIIHGFFQSLWLLIRHRPDVVFAKGGYVCLPMGIAAWLLRIPLVIHDSDTRAGLTNRMLARFATTIATGFPLDNYRYAPSKSFYTGVPIGAQFAPVDSLRQQQLKAALGFTTDAPLIVATGGGLGSDVINTAVIRAASELGSDINVFCVAGKKNYQKVQAVTGDHTNIKAVPFVYDGMIDILGAADIVVARGSATFLQELAGIGKPVIIVPAHQLGDQIKNAQLYEKEDAAVVLRDSELGEGKLTSTISALLAAPARMHELATNLHGFAKPDAAEKVAQLIAAVQENAA